MVGTIMALIAGGEMMTGDGKDGRLLRGLEKRFGSGEEVVFGFVERQGILYFSVLHVERSEETLVPQGRDQDLRNLFFQSSLHLQISKN